MRTLRNALGSQPIEVVAAAGLVCLYLALMNGHLISIDGLVMWRQALSLAYHHSLFFNPPIWWGGYGYTGSRGLGASFEYFPGLLAFSWLAPYIPVAPGPNYDFNLFYSDPLYSAAGAPVWVFVTAATAYLVGLIVRALGFDRSASLWGMAIYGLGSPALTAARGDFLQPLVALCWATGVYASLRLHKSGESRWAWICGASIFYGVLTRPLEGSFLLPATLLLVAPAWRQRLLPAIIQVGGWLAAVVVTLSVNWARFGSPLDFGYGSISWNLPIWVGFPDALLSPGRGVLWAFPALLLTVVGAMHLWKNGKRLETLVFAGLPAILFIEACQFYAWIDGWDWGFRLFQPALPLLAVIAGIGVIRLPRGMRPWLPALLLAGGILWNIPTVTTDILGGYGGSYNNLAANWRLDAYPPIGAWRFLHHVRPQSATDSSAVDIVWFRSARSAGWAALFPFLFLMASSIGLWVTAVRANLRPETKHAPAKGYSPGSAGVRR